MHISILKFELPIPDPRGRKHFKGVLLFATLLMAASCVRVFSPLGEREERDKASRAEGVFAVAVNKRPLPDLSKTAPLSLALEYAFNANGELESAYREWRAAIERVPQAGSLPDPMLEFSTLLTPQNPSFGQLLDNLSIMLSQELPAKGKQKARAEQALAEAQSAGEKFRAEKYRLQRMVVEAYSDLAKNEALLLQASDTIRLLNQSYSIVRQRFEQGGDASLSDLRKIEVEIRNAESDYQTLVAQDQSLSGSLNGVLNREPKAPLGEVSLPTAAPHSLTDEEMFALAIEKNPDLASLRKEVASRSVGEVLAELEKKPDYRVTAGLEGLTMPNFMSSLKVGMTLPINRKRIRAAIAEALAERQASEARLRSAEFDTQARLVMAMTTLNDSQRLLDTYEQDIIPETKRLLDTQLSSYQSGAGEILDILDTERMLVDFNKLVIQARSDLTRSSAEIEEIVGTDLFHRLPAEQPEASTP